MYGPAHETIPTPSTRLSERDNIRIEELDVQFEVLEIPGHTAGHIGYYGGKLLFCGDTLFACGRGRVFEGTPEQMWPSLSKLAALPAATPRLLWPLVHVREHSVRARAPIRKTQH